MRMKKKNCGTTLVELLVVLAIAAIVLSMSTRVRQLSAKER